MQGRRQNLVNGGAGPGDTVFHGGLARSANQLYYSTYSPLTAGTIYHLVVWMKNIGKTDMKT